MRRTYSKFNNSKIQEKCWHTWWCYHIYTNFSFLVYITAIDVNDTLAMGDFIELWKHRSQPLCCACRDNDGWVGNQCTLLQYKWYYEAFSGWYCFQILIVLMLHHCCSSFYLTIKHTCVYVISLYKQVKCIYNEDS